MRWCRTAQAAWLQQLADHLSAGKPARSFDFDPADTEQQTVLHEMGLLSACLLYTSLRMRRQTSRPSMRGIITSSSTMSGLTALNFSSPSSPSFATVT